MTGFEVKNYFNNFPLAVASGKHEQNKQDKNTNKTMLISEMQESKFLRKEDCGKHGIIVTIRGVEQNNVAMADQPKEMRWCLVFEEDLKPFVVNATNRNLVASITGEQDTDQWPGHKIVLYNDPTIMYAGKLVGGIRVRAPRTTQSAPAPKAVVAAPKTNHPPEDPGPDAAAIEDDVPF